MFKKYKRCFKKKIKDMIVFIKLFSQHFVFFKVFKITKLMTDMEI